VFYKNEFVIKVNVCASGLERFLIQQMLRDGEDQHL
jgi:hypothetical protein